MRTRYSIDGGGWSDWSQDVNVNVGDGCGQSHTIKVQSGDRLGFKGPESKTVEGSSADCPEPTVVLSKYGDAKGANGGPGETCTTASCQYIRVKVANFVPGSTITCKSGFEHPTRDYVEKIPDDGSITVDTNWFNGFPGKTVSATCEGGGKKASGSLVW
jgi:hypothetical protein